MTQYVSVDHQGDASQASCTAPAHHIAGLQLAAAATVAAAAHIASGPFEALSDDLQHHILLCAVQHKQISWVSPSAWAHAMQAGQIPSRAMT